jgi:putative membrane protein
MMNTWGGHYVAGNAAGMMFPGLTVMLLWIAIVVGIVYLVLYVRRNSKFVPIEQESSRAEEILRERFARGEVDREDFEERIKALRI